MRLGDFLVAGCLWVLVGVLLLLVVRGGAKKKIKICGHLSQSVSSVVPCGAAAMGLGRTWGEILGR